MQKVLTPIFASLLDVKGGRRRHQEVLHEDVKERCMNETFMSLFWIVYGIRHGKLVHSSSFTAKQVREKELHSQRLRDKELRLCPFPRA